MQIRALCQLVDEYCLLAQADKVYGPYSRSDGRKHVIVVKEDGSAHTVSYPKYLMEQHLGRPLHPDEETVDHLNCDKTDDRLENLRVVPRDIHSGDDTRRVKHVEFECGMCGKKFERSPRLVRDKSKKGRTGIFCSRQCAGKYSRKLQLGLIDKLPVQPYIESEYYRRKNVVALARLFAVKYVIG